jgi:RNA polymerase sigma-70 factor (ECF subfamily)
MISPVPTYAGREEQDLNGESKTYVVQEIARHQSRLRGFLRCLLVHARDIDDLLQEINAVLWEKSAEFEAGTDFWAWASQVARFKVFNYLRSLGRERLVFDEQLLGQLADAASMKLQRIDERREALEHCLRQLPMPQRQLIELRYSSRQTIETISESLGRPAASLRQSLYRIRQALQACIEGQLATGEKQP